MAVVLRGWTQMTAQASAVSVAWPAGTAAGDVAVVVTDGGSTLAQRGWTSYTEGVFAKVLVAADYAAPLVVDDTLAALQVFSGARGIGATRYRTGSAGLTLSEAGAGLLVHGWSQRWDGDIAPDTARLGDKVDHEHYMNAVWWVAASATGYLGLSDTDQDASYVSYEILPMTVPAAPIVTGPTAGSYVDAAAAIGVSWIAAGQTAVKVKLTKVSDSSVTYLLADGTVTATETAITTAVLSESINAGVLTAGQAYDLRIATANAAGWGAYSAATRFTPLARPTVNTITVTCPAGDLSPTVAWTMTAGLGVQQGWQARICAAGDADSTNPIWDSGIRSGTALSVTAPADTPWTDGAWLYAWVRVMDGAQWSAWTRDDLQFRVDWAQPAAPTAVTLTDTAPMTITVTGIAAGAAGLQVYISPTPLNPGTFVLVAEVLTPSATTAVRYPLAPYGVTLFAQARVWVESEGVRLYGASRVSAAGVASTDMGAYLVSDTAATDYLPVGIIDDGDQVLVQGVGASYGMGADFARTDRSKPAGVQGRIVFDAETLADRLALVDWLSSRAVWRLRWNPEMAGSAYADTPPTRMTLASAVGWSRYVQHALQGRDVVLDWVEQ